MAKAPNRAELLQDLNKGVAKLDTSLARVEGLSENVQAGLDAADAALALAGKLPFMQAPCEAARSVLQFVCQHADRAADLLDAARLMVDTLNVLKAAAAAILRLPEEERRDAEAMMDELLSMLKEVKELVEAFGKKGWFAKAVKMKRHANTLSKLDTKIRQKLDAICKLQQLAASIRQAEGYDALMAKLQDVGKYVLEHKIAAAKTSLVESGADEDAAATKLLSDPAFLEQIAAAGVGHEA